MSASGAIIGVDGGGTTTRALAVASDGSVLGRGTSTSSNPNNVGYAEAARSILEAIQSALADAPKQKIASICLGIAGVADEQAKRALREELLRQAPELGTASLRITHDLEIAHFAAFNGKAGVCLIAGTGSACYAKNEAGEEHRQSGRGAGLEDPGSGYAIAKRAIEAGFFNPPESSARADIAALAPQILAAAEKADGDEARNILRLEANEAAELAVPAIEWLRADRSGLAIALFGGLLARSGLYHEMVLTTLRARFPSLSIIRPKLTALEGAAKLAARASRNEASPRITGTPRTN